MKIADVKIGEIYQMGDWMPRPVKVLAPNQKIHKRYTYDSTPTTQRAFEIEYLTEDLTPTGNKAVVLARQLNEPWSEYVEKQRIHRENEAKRQALVDRLSAAFENLGVPDVEVSVWRGMTVIFTPEQVDQFVTITTALHESGFDAHKMILRTMS